MGECLQRGPPPSTRGHCKQRRYQFNQLWVFTALVFAEIERLLTSARHVRIRASILEQTAAVAPPSRPSMPVLWPPKVAGQAKFFVTEQVRDQDGYRTAGCLTETRRTSMD
jgi:hypothetical protein